MTESAIAFRGEVATPRSLLRRALGLAAPALAWILVFLIAPLCLVLAVAFCGRGDYGQIEWRFTLDNLGRALGFAANGFSDVNLRIAARTLWLSAGTTAVCLALAFALSLVIATRRPGLRALLLAAVMIPFGTNLVIRTYGWQLLLAGKGPLAPIAVALGLSEPGLSLYPSPLAVWIGMIAALAPFAVAPLYAVVERLDWSLVEAARDLNAGRWRVLRHAVLPQIAPGLTAAAVLTFIPALGMFVVSDLLGGAKHMLIGNLVQQQLARDWPYGAALGLWLIVATLAALALARRGLDRAHA